MSRSKDAWCDWDDDVPEPPSPSTFVLFDTETTGTSAEARIVEIAALRVDNGREVRRFETLVNPECQIPRNVSAIHGIYDRDVRDAPKTREAINRFALFVGRPPLVAHNASFDVRMLRGERQRVRVRLPVVDVLCTLKVARTVLSGAQTPAGGHKLQSLAVHFGIRVPSAHRAMADVVTLLAVLRALLRLTPGKTLRELHGPAESLVPLEAIACTA